MVRRRTATKTTKLREPQANGQLRTTRTTTSIPRSRKPTKMTRQQIIIIFFLNKEENKPTKKASASSSPLGPPLPSSLLPPQPARRNRPPYTHTQPFLPSPPWSSSPSRVNPLSPAPPGAALPLTEHTKRFAR